MSLGTRLYTLLYGELVGTDRFGNRYYRGKKPLHERERRWVLYSGAPEASKVPPEWHGWLHGGQGEPPKSEAKRLPWQREHLPNRTGTALAYRPPGHTLEGGRRAAATGDYEPWVPN